MRCQVNNGYHALGPSSRRMLEERKERRGVERRVDPLRTSGEFMRRDVAQRDDCRRGMKARIPSSGMASTHVRADEKPASIRSNCQVFIPRLDEAMGAGIYRIHGHPGERAEIRHGSINIITQSERVHAWFHAHTQRPMFR